MAMDMFLKFSDAKLKGEALDELHKDEINLLSWHWSANNSSSIGKGSGSGSGKVKLHDLVFTKYIDKASAPLLLATCNGTHIATATLTIRKSGGDKAVNYLVIQMDQVFITDYSTAGESESDQLTEHVTLSYGSLKFVYQQQDSKGGKMGGEVTAMWNQIKNNSSIATA